MTCSCKSLGWWALLLALALPKTSRAAGPSPGWAKFSVTYDQDRFAELSSIPAGYDAAEVLRCLLPGGPKVSDTQVETIRKLVVKPWPAQPGQTVAAVEVRTYQKEGTGGATDAGGVVRVAVLAGGAQGQPLVRRSMAVFDVDAQTELARLDLAPYRVTPDSVALGVRTNTNFAYAGGGGQNIALRLFVADGNRLRSILSTLLVSTSITAGEWNDDGSRDHEDHGSDKPATIAVLKTKSNGYFDLKKTLGKASCVLRWDGSRYLVDDTDPVSDVNE